MVRPKVVHCQKSNYDILIDRTTKWGNPFRRDHVITEDDAISLGDPSLVNQIVTRDQCIDLFEVYLRANETLISSLHELDGKVLGCWCKNADGTGKRCHGDVLVKLFIEEENKKIFDY